MPARPRPGAPDADPDPATIVLPTIPNDPLASLGSNEIEVWIAGKQWVVPAMSASQWLTLLWADPFDPDSIFPDLVDADEDVFDGILDGSIPFNDVFEVAMEILEEASGYRWWFTLRLTSLMKEMWPRLGGMMINRGMRAQDMNLGAWCTAAYALCLENQKPADAYKFANSLNDPPPGIEDPEAVEGDAAAFLAAMSAPY